ncbi:MAG: hypothetical protein IPK87_03185 [Planctomycetes bacterium]|nr:hypothetical protein [Planctomycetota bacterium]
MSQQPNDPETRYVLVQTPAGVFKFAVPAKMGTDPVAIAMEMFQTNVDSGAADPLQQTLLQLKAMAEQGTDQPLITGLMLLRQMAEKGLLPPLPVLVEGTGITEEDLTQAGGSVQARAEVRREGLLDRLDNENLN